MGSDGSGQLKGVESQESLPEFLTNLLVGPLHRSVGKGNYNKSQILLGVYSLVGEQEG